LPEGKLEYLGRVDHQIKVRGYRIELGEIESALLSHAQVKKAVVIAQPAGADEKRLVGYVVADESELKALQSAQSSAVMRGEMVEQWHGVYDSTYSNDRGASLEPSFAGWNSSYTGEPIPLEQMQGWLKRAVERIEALRPRKVLEIGCGVGLVVAELADRCERYCGSDISAVALQRLGAWLNGRAELSHVQLRQARADEFDDLPRGEFDTVVLNSVVQYFPDVEYLLEVLAGAVERVSQGGRVFIGDIRHLGLLDAFHSSVQLRRAPDESSVGQLRQRIARAVQQDKELVIDPQLFVELPKYLPGITQVEIQLKGGGGDNELTRYRYDVVLHVGAVRQAAALRRVRWSAHHSAAQQLQQHVSQGSVDEGISIEGIVNGRIAGDLAALELIAGSDERCTVQELRQQLAAMSIEGVAPEEFDEWARAHGYEARLCWGQSSGCFEVQLVKSTRYRMLEQAPQQVQTEVPSGWALQYANDPLIRKLKQQLPLQLREWLVQKLPQYMVPAAVVVLDELPLTPNGKVDRKALPALEESTAGAASTPPEGMTEQLLAELWCALLKRERVGRHDDFFELGGHSLLAMELASRIRETFSTELAVRELFEHHTLSSQARAVERARGAGALADVAMEAVSRDEPLPLSYAQQRLWFLHQYMGPSAVYNMPLALRLRGEVNEAALVRSLEELHRRHESLRTRFETHAGSAVQVIDPPGRDLEVETVSAAEAQAIARAERFHCFDLSSERLCRVRLLRERQSDKAARDEPGDYVLLVTMHHSVSDGWSLGIFFRELVSLYQVYTKGERSPLAPLPIQYADYAQWQRRWLQGSVLEQQVSYWREQLKDLPPLLTLPTDRPRPAEQTFRGSMEPFALPVVLAEKLRALSREQSVTLYMTLLSAFAVLLGRYSGQQDVAVGTPIANRTRRETEGLIGFFVNTLVMRHDLSGDPRFVELLTCTRETALQAYAHQDVPFEQLVEELSPQRSLSHSPLFQVVFAMQNATFEALELPGLAVQSLEMQAAEEGEGAPGGTARFDLALGVQESPAGLVGALEYNTDLFERSTIRRMLDHYARLLEAIVASPQSRLSQLEMLGEEEKRQQLIEWNATSRSYPDDKCIHELFEAQALLCEDADAVVCGEATLTYAALDARANRLARFLKDNGIGPDRLVGICMERSVDLVVAVLGVLKAGGAYLPLDPSYPPKRLAYMLEDAAPPVVLTQEKLRPVLEPTSAQLFALDTIAERLAEYADERLPPSDYGLTSRHLVYVIYTSGSTGAPKGVMVEHRGLCNLARAQIVEFLEVGRSSRVLQFASLSFDASAWEIVMGLCSGATLHLPVGNPALAGAWLLDELEQAGITHVTLPPALLAGLAAQRGLEELHTLVVAGEACSQQVVESWSPGRQFFNAYGPTEATVCATTYRCDSNERAAPAIGRPISNARIYLLDRHMRPMPIGVAGEIYIGGVGIARGYLNRAQLTAGRFVPDPFGSEQGARLYRTGDMGRWLPDGNMEFLGRMDDQVKVRGFRIELGEIESVLLGHEAVRAAVVVARDEASGSKRLVGYVVPAASAQADGVALVNALRSRVQEQLPGYMVPSAFVVLETLPLTATGKVDRKALPPPDEAAQTEYAAPEGATEELLAQLWCAVLKRERVGRHDSFFDLGGHSLLATQLVSRIRESFSTELPVKEVFEHATLSSQAHAVERSRGAGARTEIRLEAVSRDEPLPLSYAQQRMLFLQEFMK
jgi:amino acid adenylation domain-containing protein